MLKENGQKQSTRHFGHNLNAYHVKLKTKQSVENLETQILEMKNLQALKRDKI
jgi:hypothetical protein